MDEELFDEEDVPDDVSIEYVAEKYSISSFDDVLESQDDFKDMVSDAREGCDGDLLSVDHTSYTVEGSMTTYLIREAALIYGDDR